MLAAGGGTEADIDASSQPSHARSRATAVDCDDNLDPNSPLPSGEQALQMSAASEWRVRQEFQQFGREMADQRRVRPSRAPVPVPALSLCEIRDDLIRQEDSIIFALIERAQFQRNGERRAAG